jgi:hypothetical protein
MPVEEYHYVPIEYSCRSTLKEKGYIFQFEFRQKAFNVWDVLVAVLPESEPVITMDDNTIACLTHTQDLYLP